MVRHARAGARKYFIRRPLILLVIIGALVGGLAAIAYRPTLTPLTIGMGHYMVRVVSTEAAREQGLSGTASLPAGHGMLFVFDSNDQWGIWMKDMNYPIDILWLDQSKTVVDIVANASPASYPTVFKPKAPARYVLELPAGSIAAASIAIGQHATFNVSLPGGAGS